MFHIDNPSGVEQMPKVRDVESTTIRYFTEEKDQASYPGADWFNIVMLELLNILKLSNVAPDKFKYNQIATVIVTLINERLAAQSSVFETVDEGLNKTASGQYFSVPQGLNSEQSFKYYRNDGGIALLVTDAPSSSSVRILDDFLTVLSAQQASLTKSTEVLNQYSSNKWQWILSSLRGPSETALALDNDFGLWLAGLESCIQDYIEQLIPKNLANRYQGFQHVIVDKMGKLGLVTIDDAGDIRIVGMDDVLQDRLDAICSANFSRRIVGFQFVIFSADLKTVLFAIDDNGGIHVPGVDGPLQDKLGESRAKLLSSEGVPAAAWDNKVVWAERPVLTVQKLTDAGMVFSYLPGGEAASGAGVMYIPSIREMPLDATEIHGGGSSGQSLNTPYDKTGNTNIVNRDPAFRGRLLAAANGKPEGDGGRGMGNADRTTLNDMSYPQYRQGNVLPLYNSLMSLTPGNMVFMHAGFAVGGYPFSKIKKGTVPYNKGLALIQLYKTAADAVGKPYTFKFLTFEHGESDNDNGDNPNPGDYLAKETEYFSDFQADVTPITGQDEKFTVVIGQVGSRINTQAGEIDDEGNPTGETVVVQPYSVSAVDQTAYVRKNPTTAIMYGPKYPINWLFSDGTMSHLNAAGKVIQGEYTAQAIHWHIYDTEKKGTWTGLKVRKVTLNGAVADLLCDVPYTPIVIDDAFIRDCPGKGISLEHNSAAVLDVQIVDGNTIRVEFDKAPAHDDMLLIGFTNTQQQSASNKHVYPLTCFRDSSPVISKWVTLGGVPFPLYNWLCLDRLPLSGEI